MLEAFREGICEVVSEPRTEQAQALVDSDEDPIVTGDTASDARRPAPVEV